jgi:hypothetical protein
MYRRAELPTRDLGRKKQNWRFRLIMVFLLLPAALITLYTWVALHYVYSSGERSGYIQKISRKGWICKTWEGELAMTTVPGTAPRIFRFSVRNDATARKIEQAAGQPVVLSYEQHKGVPSSCFGETEYFITGVGQSVSRLDEPYITSGVAWPGPREFPYPKAILAKDSRELPLRTPTRMYSNVHCCGERWKGQWVTDSQFADPFNQLME